MTGGRAPHGRLIAPALLGAWAVGAAIGTASLPGTLLLGLPVVTALAAAPRWPLTGLVAAFAALFLAGSVDEGIAEDPFLAMVVYACYVFGRHAALVRQPWAAAGVLLLLSLNLLEPARDATTADAVFPVLLTAAPWLLGASVQLAHRREREAVRYAGDLDAARAEEVRRAALEERLRIARDLHDVVAHDITAISLQAQVMRRTAEAGGVVRAADLRSIEGAAQQAMNDVRSLLGVLRPADGSAPVIPGEGFEQLHHLLDGCRRLGQQVDLTVHGQPHRLPPALSQALFRIVQEALTNARRHGASGRTRLDVGWADEGLSLEIRNAMLPGAEEGVRGHGITGIEERAHMFGGTASVTADPREGVWCVGVHLPVPRPVRAVSP
jgi:signal transduction histidine kinase